MAVDSPTPQASGLSRDSVYRLAESVAKQLEFHPGDPIDPIVRRLGGTIEVKDFSRSDSGSMDVRGEGNFTIFVSSTTSRQRDRFTIAHELGHYILHYLWPRSRGKPVEAFTATRYGSDRVEWEANWFAAAFLMPEAEFRQAFHAENARISDVADQFDVSLVAAEVRARALGLRG